MAPSLLRAEFLEPPPRTLRSLLKEHCAWRSRLPIRRGSTVPSSRPVFLWCLLEYMSYCPPDP